MGPLSNLSLVFGAHDCHQAMGSFSSGLGRQGTKDTDAVLAPLAPGCVGGAGGAIWSVQPPIPQGKCIQVSEEMLPPALSDEALGWAHGNRVALGQETRSCSRTENSFQY